MAVVSSNANQFLFKCYDGLCLLKSGLEYILAIIIFFFNFSNFIGLNGESESFRPMYKGITKNQ